jgi:uncharacterized protein (DUF885 family)
MAGPFDADRVGAATGGEGDEFDRAVAQFLREYLEAEPVGASFYGLTEWDGLLPDMTADGFAEREAAAARWLDRFAAWPADSLTPGQRIDLALLLAHLGQQVATADFAAWQRYPTMYLENGVFELFVHGTRDEPAAVEAAVQRLTQVPGALRAGQENLDPALVDAELVRQWAIPNAAAQASFMREGLAGFVADPGRRTELAVAGAVAAKAYDEYVEYLGDLAGRATGSFVFGEERYDSVLRIGEGFDFGARTLRDMGREQVDSLTARMAALAEEIDGTPDWPAVISRLRDDHPASMDELLESYRNETDRARAFVRANGLMSIPDGEECAVEPAPLFLRAALARDVQRALHARRRQRGGAGGPPALELVLRDPRGHGPRGLPRAPPPLRRLAGDQRAPAGPAEHLHGRGLGPLRGEHDGGAGLLRVARRAAGAVEHAAVPGRPHRGRHQSAHGRDEH